MKHHTLGPVIETFGPHVRISLAFIGIGGLFSWFAFAAASEPPNRAADWAIFYCVATGFGLLTLRHLCFRVWLHEGGISYRGILGHCEIRWRELDRIYVGAYSIHFHYVALGDFCRLRLITKQGVKYSIGERVHGTESLAELIQGYTVLDMARTAVREFESGVELDFGRIHLHRKNGVT